VQQAARIAQDRFLKDGTASKYSPREPTHRRRRPKERRTRTIREGVVTGKYSSCRLSTKPGQHQISYAGSGRNPLNTDSGAPSRGV
jgi:hypothetical protein